MKEIIDQYWKETPHFWSRLYGAISPTTFFLKSRYKKIIPHLKDLEGKKILDVGCGSGVFMKVIIDNGGYVVGMDYSKDMIVEAQKTLKNYSKNHYKLVVGNAVKLPFKVQSFDMVLASGLTDYLNREDNRKFLKEVARVLVSKGAVIITFPKKESPFQFLREGFGLKLRKIFLSLPPMLTSFSKAEINALYKMVGITVKQFDTVFHTMWITVCKKNN